MATGYGNEKAFAQTPITPTNDTQHHLATLPHPEMLKHHGCGGMGCVGVEECRRVGRGLLRCFGFFQLQRTREASVQTCPKGGGTLPPPPIFGKP